MLEDASEVPARLKALQCDPPNLRPGLRSIFFDQRVEKGALLGEVLLGQRRGLLQHFGVVVCVETLETCSERGERERERGREGGGRERERKKERERDRERKRRKTART